MTEGERQVLGIDVGPFEDSALCDGVSPQMNEAGLKDVRFVAADDILAYRFGSLRVVRSLPLRHSMNVR